MCIRIRRSRIRLKNTLVVLFAILSLLSMPFLAGWKTFGMSDSKVISVPTDFLRIQDAINNATVGDTIFVRSGTYNEDIALNKSVSLIGESRDSTVINSVDAQYVISILASDATVCSFTVTNIFPQGDGIIMYSGHNITICNNTIRDGHDGLIAFNSFGNHVSGNAFLNNSDYGINLYSSPDNVFSDNTISDNGVSGLEFASSSNNVILGNTISNNSLGVNLIGSSNNLFSHNNFANAIQVTSDSNNTWYRGGEGNYWSSYVGSDLNGDGIGDTEYITNPSAIDAYPLMGPFHNFNISSGKTAYQVFVVSNSTVDGLAYEVGPETGNKIIHFEVADENGTAGFCRLLIPTELMSLPYIVLDSDGEVTYTLLNASNETNAVLYFTYPKTNQTITAISSKTQQLYLQLSANQTTLLGYLGSLNSTNLGLLGNYTNLLDFLIQLQNSYLVLNSSYQQHLSANLDTVHNLQNLIYIFAATTVIFLITTVYLSRRVRAGSRQRGSNA